MSKYRQTEIKFDLEIKKGEKKKDLSNIKKSLSIFKLITSTLE